MSLAARRSPLRILSERQDAPNDNSTMTKPQTTSAQQDQSLNPYAAAGIGIGLVILIIVLYFAWVRLHVRSLHRRYGDDGQGDAEKKGFWQRLGRRRSRRAASRGEYTTRLPDESVSDSRHGVVDMEEVGSSDRGGRTRVGTLEQDITDQHRGQHQANSSISSTTNGNAAGIDRNTSIRSVMTLPAYSKSVRETEQVLGREGERAGIDIVLEHPETYDEEEERREEEMNSLYQIRRQRRAEQVQREERRRQRREARERGDSEALARLQAESRNRQEQGLDSQRLIQEHQGRNRERRVSSVQYAELGVARHDGSRVRKSDISEEDRRPLLDSSSSIYATTTRDSLGGRSLTSQHYRDVSNSSVLSVNTMGSTDDYVLPTLGSGGRDGNTDFELVSSSQNDTPGSSSQRSRSHSPGYFRSRQSSSSVATAQPQQAPYSAIEPSTSAISFASSSFPQHVTPLPITATTSATGAAAATTAVTEPQRNQRQRPSISIPSDEPPLYDSDLTAEWGDAPAYESPVATSSSLASAVASRSRLANTQNQADKGQRLSQLSTSSSTLRAVPSIEITPFTPIDRHSSD